MSHYFFDITDDKFVQQPANAKVSALTYKHFENPDDSTAIFYKLTAGKVTHIICQAKDKDAAAKAVEIFLLHRDTLITAG